MEYTYQNVGGDALPTASVAVQNPDGEPEVPHQLRLIAERLQKHLEHSGMISVQKALDVTSDLFKSNNVKEQKRVLASLSTIEMYNNTWMIVCLEHPNDPPSGETEGFTLSL